MKWLREKWREHHSRLLRDLLSEAGVVSHNVELIKENAALREKIQGLRNELNQCVQDFRFIGQTGHHSDYSDRRMKAILGKLEDL